MTRSTFFRRVTGGVSTVAVGLVAGVLGLSVAAPAMASAPGLANLTVSTTVDNWHPGSGDTVTYTVTVQNTGWAEADNVVIKNFLPAGVTYTWADHDCHQADGTGECSLGTIPAGGWQVVRIQATVTDPSPAQHQTTVQKAETELDLDPGQTASATVSCPTGYAVLDGSARRVAVDQGTGTFADVSVLASKPTSLTDWTVTLHNGATGRSQNKVFALCVATQLETINGSTPTLQGNVDPAYRTVALGAGHTDVTLSCDLGEIPVAPGFSLDGKAEVTTSYPTGASSWTFGVDNAATGGATQGTFSINCAKDYAVDASGARYPLQLWEQRATVTIPAGATPGDGALTQHCENGKGIVAGYRGDAGLLNLGNEPRPVDRVYFVSNPTSQDLHADAYLLCLGVRTQGADGTHAVATTFTAYSTSRETDTGDNSSTVTVTVGPATAAAAHATPAAAAVVVSRSSAVSYRVACAGGTDCRTTVKLVALSHSKAAGHSLRRGAVLARGSVRIAHGKAVTAHLRPTALGRKALADRHLRRAQIQVGQRVRTVAITH